MSTGVGCIPKYENVCRVNGKMFHFVPSEHQNQNVQLGWTFYNSFKPALQQVGHLAHAHWPLYREAFAKLHSYHVAEFAGTGFHKFREFLV